MTMTKRSLKILIVDDAENVTDEVKRGLLKLGITSTIIYCCPLSEPERFGGCTLPAGTDCDDIDLALVDLELFPIKDYLNPAPEDLRGGTEILPYLRQEAPWIPVVAYSQHFVRTITVAGSERFLPLACGFGFDGYLPRGLFTSLSFTQSQWDVIYGRAILLRARAVLGDEFHSGATAEVDLVLHVESEKSLDREFPSWRSVVRDIFHFADRVVLNPLSGGWSGAAVFRAFAQQSKDFGGKEGQWLLKLSRSPAKLHKEARAHLRMTRSGVEYARNVQLLWPEPVVECMTAGIAYQFAHGTKEAANVLSEVLGDRKKTKDAFQRMGNCLKGFYATTSTMRDIIANVLQTWSSSKGSLIEAATEIGSGGVSDLLRSIASGESSPTTGKAVRFQQCLIHGDLHLGNIMLGERDVLIDFARSALGPVAVDLGRLAADILIRIPTLRETKLTICEGNDSKFREAFELIIGGLKIGDEDRILADLFLQVFLAQYLNYDSVLPETKRWLLSVLKKQVTI